MRRTRFPLMVFAAGFGTRMRALTADRPKPLLAVAGRSLLDRALDLGRAAGAGPIVVNTHYLGQQIADHLAGSEVLISDEAGQILETGGGLRRALQTYAPQLGAGPVLTLNPDVVWRGPNPLEVLQAAWDPAQMDALLLLMPRKGLPGRGGNADFVLDAKGRISRANDADGMVYLGAQILDPRGLAAIPETTFSLNILWNQMIAAGRAYGVAYPGLWCDVGSPEGLAEAETLLAAPDAV